MKTLLWLDDYRDPFKSPDWLIFSPIGKDIDVIWVKSYTEFCNYIDNNPLPDAICFDHDLGYNSEGADELSGYDAAKYLVKVCINKRAELPMFFSQSSNPVGKQNIISYLENAKKFIENS